MNFSKNFASGWVSLAVFWGSLSLAGCQPSPHRASTEQAGHDHHDHPAHGPNGGHLVHLEPSGSHAEWTHDDELGKIQIHLEDVQSSGKKIDSVKVVLKVQDQPEKTFDFTAVKDGLYELVSPELLTAIEVGGGDSEKVSAKLSVAIDGQEQSSLLEHHDHHHH
jgi:hypothetical protein